MQDTIRSLIVQGQFLSNPDTRRALVSKSPRRPGTKASGGGGSRKRFETIAALGVLACCLSISPDATAGQLYAYSFHDSTISVSGTLTANPNGNGSFTAVAGTAVLTGAPLNGSLTFVTNPNAPGDTIYSSGDGHVGVYDDQLFPGSSPLIANGGLLFIFPNSVYLNIFSSSPTAYIAQEITSTRTIYYRSQTPGTFTLRAVPEPSSVAMFGIGIAALNVWMRRRWTKNSV